MQHGPGCDPQSWPVSHVPNAKHLLLTPLKLFYASVFTSGEQVNVVFIFVTCRTHCIVPPISKMLDKRMLKIV